MPKECIDMCKRRKRRRMINKAIAALIFFLMLASPWLLMWVRR